MSTKKNKNTEAIDLKQLLRTLPNRGIDDDFEYKHPRGYVGWGPHEDYFCGGDKDKGWATNQYVADSETFLSEHSGFDPDLNLVADFYFDIQHDVTDCECDGTGYAPAAKRLADDFYDHSSRTGKGWHNQITQDEVDALVAENRLWDLTHAFVPGEGWKKAHANPTAAQVNAWENGRGIGHDAINRSILIRTRAERFGFPVTCPLCDGEGHRRTSPDYLVLNIWMLHPRKGASRAIEVKRVDPADLPRIKAFLANSWTVHKRHFAWTEEPDGKA